MAKPRTRFTEIWIINIRKKNNGFIVEIVASIQSGRVLKIFKYYLSTWKEVADYLSKIEIETEK